VCSALPIEGELAVHRSRPVGSTRRSSAGLADWFGVPAEQMPNVLPNAANFNRSQLFSREDLFG
jgi:hypothetical protein